MQRGEGGHTPLSGRNPARPLSVFQIPPLTIALKGGKNKGGKDMTDCQKCGVVFHDETNPLATICRDCRDEAADTAADLAEAEATGN